MERNLTFVQDVQDAYAVLTDLTMIILDEEGNEVTNVSRFNPFTKTASETYITKDMYKNYMKLMVNKTSVFDNEFGLKLIVAPIHAPQHTYYLFAGYFLDKLSLPYVNKFLKENFGKDCKLLEYLDCIREISEEEKLEKIRVIARCTNVIEDYLASQLNKQIYKQKLSLIYDKMESIRTGNAETSSFLEREKRNNSLLDFIGLAVSANKEQYVVETVHGEKAAGLQGQTFLTGEGFLGHVIATQQPQFWKLAPQDPRNYFFHQYGLYPKSLFCVPIFSEGNVTGVLFGGSYHNEITDNTIMEQFKLNSSLLSILISSQRIKADLENHLMELSTFNEIFRVLTTVKDIRRVLYILVDISINITRGPFACIVFKPRKGSSKVEIVSRGLSASEVTDYGNHIANKAFANPSKWIDAKEPVIGEPSWGGKVLELPLTYNNQIYGMLCVGFNANNNPEKYYAFLSSLAVAGSISIHLCQEEKKMSDEYVVNLLEEAMYLHNKEEHNKILKVKDHIQSFKNFLNESDSQPLTMVSGLVCHDLSFIERYIHDKELLSTLIGCKNALQYQKGTNRNSEILALIYYYVSQNENKETVNSLTNISKTLRQQFLEYTSRENVVEMELSYEVSQSFNGSTQQKETQENILKKEFSLSVREIEVLNLLLKGFNNRELAEKLFISEHTVKNHVTHILQKLKVSDRSQAIAMVYQLGYLPPDP